jgi:hypothetical protein
MPETSSLEAEFDALMARAGLTVPATRRAAWLASFEDLRTQLALLNRPRSPVIEPANVFRVTLPESGR